VQDHPVVQPLALRLDGVPARQCLDDLGSRRGQKVAGHVGAGKQGLGAEAEQLELVVEVAGSQAGHVVLSDQKHFDADQRGLAAPGLTEQHHQPLDDVAAKQAHPAILLEQLDILRAGQRGQNQLL